jgi:hypothetical protein
MLSVLSQEGDRVLGSIRAPTIPAARHFRCANCWHTCRAMLRHSHKRKHHLDEERPARVLEMALRVQRGLID